MGFVDWIFNPVIFLIHHLLVHKRCLYIHSTLVLSLTWILHVHNCSLCLRQVMTRSASLYKGFWWPPPYNPIHIWAQVVFSAVKRLAQRMNRKRSKWVLEDQPSLPSFSSFCSTFPSLKNGCGIASVLDVYCVLSYLTSGGYRATLCSGACFHYFLTNDQPEVTTHLIRSSSILHWWSFIIHIYFLLNAAWDHWQCAVLVIVKCQPLLFFENWTVGCNHLNGSTLIYYAFLKLVFAMPHQIRWEFVRFRSAWLTVNWIESTDLGAVTLWSGT